MLNRSLTTHAVSSSGLFRLSASTLSPKDQNTICDLLRGPTAPPACQSLQISVTILFSKYSAEYWIADPKDIQFYKARSHCVWSAGVVLQLLMSILHCASLCWISWSIRGSLSRIDTSCPVPLRHDVSTRTHPSPDPQGDSGTVSALLTFLLRNSLLES